MFYNDPNFSSYDDYVAFARNKGNTPLSESTIASYVSAARSAGLTDALQQVFLGSNPGDWGRFNSAFDELGISYAQAPTAYAPGGGATQGIEYAAPGGGGQSAAAIATATGADSLAVMSLTGAASGGGQLIAPIAPRVFGNTGVVGPSQGGAMVPGYSAPSQGIPWLLIAVAAAIAYWLYNK